MGISTSDAIFGLQNTINTISETDIRLNRNLDQYSGIPIPSQVRQGTVRNKKLIIWQIGGLPSSYTLPDLTMKINPHNLSEQYSQLINHKRTWAGFVEEHWGEQLDSLSASGQSASFYGQLGLTSDGRRDTDNFKSFEQFVQIYRNNGTLYDSKTNRILAQGYVVMNYDDAVYRGYFDSFNLNEIAEKPYQLEYDFTFKVTKEVYPGRVLSFTNVTTVPTPGAIRNDRSTLDIVNIPTGQTNG